MRRRIARPVLSGHSPDQARPDGSGLSYEDLVEALRRLPGLQDVGRQHPNFHFRSRPFLHFHGGEDGLFADVRFGAGDFEPVWASTSAEREALLEKVSRHVERLERSRKADRPAHRRR